MILCTRGEHLAPSRAALFADQYFLVWSAASVFPPTVNTLQPVAIVPRKSTRPSRVQRPGECTHGPTCVSRNFPSSHPPSSHRRIASSSTTPRLHQETSTSVRSALVPMANTSPPVPKIAKSAFGTLPRSASGTCSAVTIKRSIRSNSLATGNSSCQVQAIERPRFGISIRVIACLISRLKTRLWERLVPLMLVSRRSPVSTIYPRHRSSCAR